MTSVSSKLISRSSERRHWNVNPALLKTGMTIEVLTGEAAGEVSNAAALDPSAAASPARGPRVLADARARKRKSLTTHGSTFSARALAGTSHARRRSSPFASALSATRAAKSEPRAPSRSAKVSGAKRSRLSRSFVESDSFSWNLSVGGGDSLMDSDETRSEEHTSELQS